MENTRAARNIGAYLGHILTISVIMAACVAIGSWLTQSMLNVPINYDLIGILALAFGIITAFGGIVFMLFTK